MLSLPDHQISAIVIAAAFALDLAFGDPRWLPHPVRGIGWMIQKGEDLLLRPSFGDGGKKLAGVALVVLIVLPVYFVTHFFVQTAFEISFYVGNIFSALLAYTTLAARGLADAAGAVLVRLEAGDINSARTELSMIVGRDTADLDEKEIVRAVVETVAENASDGVVAPLFYLAIGGPALALAYKAVNTLDSMVGYKNEKYRYFGWASARLDDVANYFPARLTGLLLALSTALVTRSLIAARFSLVTMLRDGRNHTSPNSGYPEAAMAGALGLRLGGPSTYGGRLVAKPYLGEARNAVQKKNIEKSVRLMYGAGLFAALAGSASLFFRS
jgi:adenosylcobinamide-phosphate synthase